jgi:hypothetical protein
MVLLTNLKVIWSPDYFGKSSTLIAVGKLCRVGALAFSRLGDLGSVR